MEPNGSLVCAKFSVASSFMSSLFEEEEEEGPFAVTYVEEDNAVDHEGGLVGHVNKT